MLVSGALLLTGTRSPTVLGRPGGRCAGPAPAPATSRARCAAARRRPPTVGGDARATQIAITRASATETFETERLAAELATTRPRRSRSTRATEAEAPETGRAAHERRPPRATSAGRRRGPKPRRRAPSRRRTPMGGRRSRDGVTESEEVDYRCRRRRRSSAARPTRAPTRATARRPRRRCSSRCATSGSRRGCWARSAART